MDLLQILSIFIVGIVLFTQSYLKKKGENLATKEDIGSITKAIESAKMDYIKEIELLKSKLAASTDQEINHNNAKNDLILRFFERARTAYDLYGFVDSTFLQTTNVNRVKDFEDYYFKLNSCTKDLISDRYRLLIFFEDDSNIAVSADQIFAKVIQMNIRFIKYKEKILNSIIQEDKANLAKDRAMFEKTSSETINYLVNYYEDSAEDYTTLDKLIREYTLVVRTYFNCLKTSIRNKD